MIQAGTVFRKPNFFEQILNKGFGVLVGLGIGLRHNYLLQVPRPQDRPRVFNSDRSAGAQGRTLPRRRPGTHTMGS